MIGALLLVLNPATSSAQTKSLCKDVSADGASYVVCAFDARKDNIRTFHSDNDGAPYGDFESLTASLEDENELLLFAMNAGMYREDRSPAGYYVENGVEKRSLNRKEGPGNFHLLPNGVFFVDGDGASVLETEAFAASEKTPIFASQSGPMLVINGELHPKFRADSTSRKRRNGVGVTENGETVIFAISNGFVTFHQFAHFFREELGAHNALFFDGSVSKVYAPELSREDRGGDMGPMVGVTISVGAPKKD